MEHRNATHDSIASHGISWRFSWFIHKPLGQRTKQSDIKGYFVWDCEHAIRCIGFVSIRYLFQTTNLIRLGLRVDRLSDY